MPLHSHRCQNARAILRQDGPSFWPVLFRLSTHHLHHGEESEDGRITNSSMNSNPTSDTPPRMIRREANLPSELHNWIEKDSSRISQGPLAVPQSVDIFGDNTRVDVGWCTVSPLCKYLVVNRDTFDFTNQSKFFLISYLLYSFRKAVSNQIERTLFSEQDMDHIHDRSVHVGGGSSSAKNFLDPIWD